MATATQTERGDISVLRKKANARTGKLPIPANGGGTAKKRKAWPRTRRAPSGARRSGSRRRAGIVWAGRARSAVSSMFRESIPTSAAPPPRAARRRRRVRNGWPRPRTPASASARPIPVAKSTARPSTVGPGRAPDRSSGRGLASTTTPGRSASRSSGSPATSVRALEPVEGRVDVRSRVRNHLHAGRSRTSCPARNLPAEAPRERCSETTGAGSPGTSSSRTRSRWAELDEMRRHDLVFPLLLRRSVLIRRICPAW